MATDQLKAVQSSLQSITNLANKAALAVQQLGAAVEQLKIPANLSYYFMRFSQAGYSQAQIQQMLNPYIKLRDQIRTLNKDVAGAQVAGIEQQMVTMRETWKKQIAALEKLQLAPVTPVAKPPTQAQIRAQERLFTQQQKAAIAAQEQLGRQKSFAYLFDQSGGAAAAQKAEAYLSKYGLALKDISRVYTDAVSGIQQFTFRTKDQNGVVTSATIAADKYHNILGSTSTRFRGFTDMVMRNTVKMAEWAISVLFVYGSLQKIGEAVTILRELDEAFADIAVSTGLSKENAIKFFEGATKAARETGTNLEGVMSVYDDVLRITNQMGDTSERFAVAQKVLTDVLALSRATGLDAAASFDVLIGSAVQSRKEGESLAQTLSRTGNLLGVIALTARNSGVPMSDLANTFAIAGTTAQDAGIKFEQLGAMTAVLARSVPKDATELGNSIRRVVGVMESSSATQVLEKFGIATKEIVEGIEQTRPLGDVYREIYEKLTAGAISQSAFRQLTYGLGGGPRGQQDVATIIKNWPDVDRLTTENGKTALTTAAANSVLTEKLKTLNAQLNRLNVGWQTFVQTLGTKGGVTELIKGSADAFDHFLQITSKVLDVMGPATTRILAMVAAVAVLTKYGPAMAGLFGGFAGGMGLGLRRPVSNFAMQDIARIEGGAPSAIGQTASFLWQNKRAQIMGTAGYALMAGLGEETTGAGLAHGGAVLAGAAISTLVSGSPLIGAAIGDVVAGKIIAGVKQAQVEAIPILQQTPEQLQQNYSTILSRMGTQAALGTGIGGAIRSFVWQGAQALGATGQGTAGAENQVGLALLDIARKKGIPAAVAAAGQGPYGAQIDKERLAADLAQLITMEPVMQTKGIITPTQAAALGAVQTQRTTEQAQAQKELLTTMGMFAGKRGEWRAAYLGGTLSKSAWKEMIQGQEDLVTNGNVVFAELRKMGDVSAEKFASAWTQAGQAVRDDFQASIVRVQELQDAAAKAPPEIAEGYRKQIDQMQKDIWADWQTVMKSNPLKEAFKFPGFQNLKDVTRQQVMQAYQEAQALQKQFFQTFMVPLNIDWDSFMKDVEDQFVLVGEKAPEWMKLTGVHPEFLSAALAQFQQQSNLNIERQRDITPEMWPKFLQILNRWQNLLGAIPGYNAKNPPEPFNVIIGEDPVLKRLITTQDALRFAIEELNATEKKQLEGMWNIPEGATVMVPLTSLYYAPKGGIGAGAGINPENFGPVGDIIEQLNPPVNNATNSIDTMSSAALAAANNLNKIIWSDVGTAQALAASSQGGLMSMIGNIIPPGTRTARQLGYTLGSLLPGMNMGGGWNPLPQATQEWQNSIREMSNYSPGSVLLGMGGGILIGGGPSAGPMSNNPATMYGTVPPTNINITLQIDGQTIARIVTRYQGNSLTATSRGVGYGSGGVMG